jgi:SpoVK/Ycf46/Vps4 family AAA+-type ATPase
MTELWLITKRLFLWFSGKYCGFFFKENFMDENLREENEEINYKQLFTSINTENDETKTSKKEEKLTRGLITYKSLSSRKMFYNEKEEKDINKLKSFLQEEGLKGIQERLKEKNMRIGFPCLFSGEPGTGKTETVYQIAKETKRDIIKVDIPSIRSRKYGKAEKNIKKIFINYNLLLEKYDVTPILFINEADGLFGKRSEVTKKNRSLDQCENTMTNIMLEEMEIFKGIMIATTNLTLNMDSAFERRFLYKIDFKKPKLNVRKNILKEFFPDITDEMADEITRKYELTGGQIENITRKLEIDYIMENKKLTFESLSEYCHDETKNSFTEKTICIGFNRN